jgi:hypothetical protein
MPGAVTTVHADVVQTQRIDTVVVAQPGSQVTLHEEHAAHDYAPDPARRAAMIASPIVFGLGGAVAGIAYTTAHANCYGSDCGNSSLVLYDLIVTGVPSAPRWVVGDVSGALIYTGLRGASVAAASLISWGNDSQSWVGPFMLGFLAPVTLGIVDLATTPHREDLVPPPDGGHPEQSRSQTTPRLTGLSPMPLTDAHHRVSGGALGIAATF